MVGICIKGTALIVDDRSGGGGGGPGVGGDKVVVSIGGLRPARDIGCPPAIDEPAIEPPIGATWVVVVIVDEL